MDPVFSIGLSHFSVTLPDVATTVEQPSRGRAARHLQQPDRARASTRSRSRTLVDLHGNAFPDTVQAIAQPSPVANAFDGERRRRSPSRTRAATTSPATTTQAFDPDSAVDPAIWTPDVDGNPVDLTAADDLATTSSTKTLTIDLAFDLENGDSFTLQGVGVARRRRPDVRPLADADRRAARRRRRPSLTARARTGTVDSTGTTVDVQMSEDVDTTTARDARELDRERRAEPPHRDAACRACDVVRLVFDALMIPGDVTIDRPERRGPGRQPDDPAGGHRAHVDRHDAAGGRRPGRRRARRREQRRHRDRLRRRHGRGGRHGRLALDASSRPSARRASTVGATVDLRRRRPPRAPAGSRTASTCTATTTSASSLTGVRDIGGNALADDAAHRASSTPRRRCPYVHTRLAADGRIPDQLEVRFSEPCDLLDDLYHVATNPDGTRYVLRDSGGVLRGLRDVGDRRSTTAWASRVSFGIVGRSATDTIDVHRRDRPRRQPALPGARGSRRSPRTRRTGPRGRTLDASPTISGEDNDVAHRAASTVR